MLMSYPKRIAGVELRHLRYFIALAEAGPASACRAMIGNSTTSIEPTASRAGRRDWHRAVQAHLARPATPPTGSSLLDGARKTLDVFEQTLQAARRCGRGEHEQITIGYTNSGGFNGFVP